VVNKVERTETGIFVHSSYGTEEFDRLVFAVPGEIALQLLSNPLALEEKTLANFRSGSQKLFLTSHWPSSSRRVHDASVRVELEENIGRQEKLRIAIADLPQFARKKTQTPYYLALVGNEREFTFPQDRIADWACHTPVITPAVIEAQTQHNKISGHDRIYYCGACWGNGLHEAGVASALQVTKSFGLGVDAI
jgi:predicted NAD/FAD-binding protein